MFEVLVKPPSDSTREAAISESVGEFGWNLTYREEPDATGPGAVCLTYGFADLEVAQQAASRLRSHGEHVEGPVAYDE